MNERPQTWGVVLTVDEPVALVQGHVAWHLAQGASEVHLYLDQPERSDIQRLFVPERVRITRCDAAYWSLHAKGKPHRHEVRQVANARDAYLRCGVDWLLHCDADEFLVSPGGVEAALAQVATDCDGIVVPVAERVHTGNERGVHALEGAFRRPFRGQTARARRLFGADYALTNRGLTGHAQGKAFTRVGRALRPSVHRPRSEQQGTEPKLHQMSPDGLELLHFEGLSPLHWAAKLQRMVQDQRDADGMPLAPHRQALADAAARLPGGYLSLYDRLKRPSAKVQHALQELGLWAEPDFRLLVSLRVADVDAWVRQNRADAVAACDMIND